MTVTVCLNNHPEKSSKPITEESSPVNKEPTKHTTTSKWFIGSVNGNSRPFIISFRDLSFVSRIYSLVALLITSCAIFGVLWSNVQCWRALAVDNLIVALSFEAMAVGAWCLIKREKRPDISILLLSSLAVFKATSVTAGMESSGFFINLYSGILTIKILIITNLIIYKSTLTNNPVLSKRRYGLITSLLIVWISWFDLPSNLRLGLLCCLLAIVYYLIISDTRFMLATVINSNSVLEFVIVANLFMFYVDTYVCVSCIMKTICQSGCLFGFCF
ncbi:membrane protein S15 [Saimiriine betaherpesvirus 4]|uniref:Membrane protein S15 n=1 Tax=Saimiriine betaherpesvirus 4 TaxID=1535247 RepID=G8XT36_9BETA|nr:membrane protein S15 [Saimiriine betaherpesvirus 4]AEV80987.1 membrane protein S15 [Saimiriine betaherpesvirus 4]